MHRFLHKLLAYSLVITLSGSSGCSDQFATCHEWGKVEQSVKEGIGFLYFNVELKGFTISYHVPGTIDSFWTGLLCTHDFDSNYGNGEYRRKVIFSGTFRDDRGSLSPTTQIGGEEFYYLSLSYLEFVE